MLRLHKKSVAEYITSKASELLGSTGMIKNMFLRWELQNQEVAWGRCQKVVLSAQTHSYYKDFQKEKDASTFSAFRSKMECKKH